VKLFYTGLVVNAGSPLLTELKTLFDFGCYKYAAPDGAGACARPPITPTTQMKPAFDYSQPIY
jgi:hypothetical protein